MLSFPPRIPRHYAAKLSLFNFLFLSNDKETIYFIFKKKREKKREKLPTAQISIDLTNLTIVDLTYTKCILEGNGMQGLLNWQFSLCSDIAALNHFPLQHDTHVLSFNT